eukprot:jgi/Mesvir1/5437/Mv15496-RA.1
MYGGDEVSAIVLDVGSYMCKAGYAGEDTPKAVFPSLVGAIARDGTGGGDAAMADAGAPPEKSKRDLYVGTNAVSYRRDGMEMVGPLKNGLIEDWEVMEAIWKHALVEQLRVSPEEHPILLAEPPYNTKAIREKSVEVLFESHNVPALFVAKTAVLTSFASGRATSLVVDSGGAGTCVTAVNDGFALTKSIVRSPLGGELLTDCLFEHLTAKGVEIRPRYSFKKSEVRPGEYDLTPLKFPGTTESYRRYMQCAVVSDIKETVGRVSDAPFNEELVANIPTVSYELPDGNVIEIGAERFKFPEVMFDPAAMLKSFPGVALAAAATAAAATGAPAVMDASAAAASLQGIAQLVMESVNRCDVDVRRELFSGILLTGGNTVFPNFRERLERQVLEVAPQTARMKVVASNSPAERRFSVWIGGSILASLGSFQQMWMSQKEYKEHGATSLVRTGMLSQVLGWFCTEWHDRMSQWS